MNEEENIKKELKSIAPKLHSMKEETKKPQPFRMPLNYFDKMQQEVLEEIKKENSFEVVGKNSQRSLPAEGKIVRESFWDKVSSLLSLWLSPKPALAFGGLATLVYAAFMLFPATEEVDYFSTIDDSLLESYLEENVEDLDSDLLAELASAYNIENLDLLDEENSNLYIDEIIDLEDTEIDYLFNQ